MVVQRNPLHHDLIGSKSVGDRSDSALYHPLIMCQYSFVRGGYKAPQLSLSNAANPPSVSPQSGALGVIGGPGRALDIGACRLLC